MKLVWPPTLFQKVIAAVVAVVLVIVLIWAWISAGQRQARDLAIAEEKEARAREKEAQVAALLEENKKLQEEAKAERERNDADRAAWAAQQAALTRSVLARNEASERRIAAALAPKTQDQVSKDAKDTLGITPTPTPTGFNISIQEMQEFVALKVDRDRLSENLKETGEQLTLERQANATLRTDLDRAIKVLDDSNKRVEEQRLLKEEWIKVAESYKRVAKKGFWRKSAEVGGKVALAFGTAVIAAKVAR